VLAAGLGLVAAAGSAPDRGRRPARGRTIESARLVTMKRPARIVVARDSTVARAAADRRRFWVPPAAEGARQVLALALLQQDDGDQEQAGDHVEEDDQVERGWS
jgi:hypothetical protein